MRKFSRSIKVVGAVAGMAAGALALSITPAWAAGANPDDSVAACYVQGLEPYNSGGYIRGEAARYNCGDYVRLEAWIYKDLSLWPDPQVGYGERWLTNGRVTGGGTCDGYGLYYVTARSSTGQSHEGRHVSNC